MPGGFSPGFGLGFGSSIFATWINLVPPENNQQPKFMTMMATILQPFADSIATANALPSLFDLNLAVGSQLDIVGQWIGITRNIPVPNTNTFITLTDAQYLSLLQAKIAMNQWDGTIPGAQAVLSLLFPGSAILIQDAEIDHMSFALMSTGSGQVGLLDLFQDSTLMQNIVPAGIFVDGYFLPSGGTPYFGFDVENAQISGWDVGYWATPLLPTP